MTTRRSVTDRVGSGIRRFLKNFLPSPVKTALRFVRFGAATRYEYSPGFRGRFRSLEHALQAHNAYDLDSDQQFDPVFYTYPRVRPMLEQIPRNSLVLDIGCNSGGLGRRLISEKNCRMFGLDISERLVSLAEAKGYERAIVGQAEALPFDNESVDVAVVGELLEHVFDPTLVLKEAHRVLRPEGMLFGSVPTEKGRWGFETIRGHPYHARVFTQDGLRDLLGMFFEIEALETAPTGGERSGNLDRPTWYVFRCRRIT